MERKSGRVSIVINDQEFKTKKELTQFVRTILYGAAPEMPLGEVEQAFLLALLKRHKYAAKKVGCGIAMFFVRVNATWGSNNRCFWLRRVDGTETDFSFLECITPTPLRAEFMRACRHTISQQVIDFKGSQKLVLGPMMVCPVTGERIAIDDAHVDHTPPQTFQAIVDAFVAQYQIDVDLVPIIADRDEQLANEFADLAMADLWATFHQQNARLRLISREANLSVIRKSPSKY